MNHLEILLFVITPLLTISFLALMLIIWKQRGDLRIVFLQLENHFNHLNQSGRDNEMVLRQLSDDLRVKQDLARETIVEKLIESLRVQQDNLQKGMHDIRLQLITTLNNNTEALTKNVDKLTQNTDQRLKEISLQVTNRLTEGFEKTTATFTDVIKRLALIDEAQKRITELSSNVVSLQEILMDKRSRGAFGEVQLSALIRNVIPESHVAFQFTLKNNKRVDCILFLPEPTGNIAIDAKFPLENFQRLINMKLSEPERRGAEQQFRHDVRKHIQDIADKYIVPGQTADGAMMFIPAEAIFSEIHAHYPDLVAESQKAKVWMVSPTTMMAILTTARAVLKDAATRQQIHVIQEHLGYLAQDFIRFQQRMSNLARHIEQANTDVKEIKTSADKISNRFNKIEKADIKQIDGDELENLTEDPPESL